MKDGGFLALQNAQITFTEEERCCFPMGSEYPLIKYPPISHLHVYTNATRTARAKRPTL